MRTLIADFVIPGEPVSKQRAQVTRNGHAYTPAKTKAAEDKIRKTWTQCNYPVRVLKATDSFAAETLFFCGDRRRKDVDNLLKLVMDALNGLVWKDDSQVAEALTKRIYVTKAEARTVVIIWRITA